MVINKIKSNYMNLQLSLYEQVELI